MFVSCFPGGVGVGMGRGNRLRTLSPVVLVLWDHWAQALPPTRPPATRGRIEFSAAVEIGVPKEDVGFLVAQW